MRGDTPQKYEYITVENITGQAHSFIYVKPWTQFFDLKGHNEIPLSAGENIIMRNIDLKCDIFFNVRTNEQNHLSHFVFENLTIETKNDTIDKSLVQEFSLKNVMVNNKLIE
jgi:hypothetical protein